MVNSCFVLNCDASAKEAGEKKRLIFKVPAADLNKWMKYIPKREVSFNPNLDGVCVKHFEDRFILKEEVVNVCGEKEIFKLEPWVLTNDAIPTIFENTTGAIMPSSVESNVSAEQLESDATLFEDLIRFDSVNGTYEDEEEPTSSTKRKSEARAGRSSKKLKTSGTESSMIVGDDNYPTDELQPGSASGRPAHLKREIVPPSRIRESMPSDPDEDYEDVGSPPDSPPSPRSTRGRTSTRGKRGRPRGRGKGGARHHAPRRDPIKIKITPIPSIRSSGFREQSDQKPINRCFMEYCSRNPHAALFKMPQMTKTKLKDWMRYIPAAATTAEAFNPNIHFLCEDHFDKKFIMNTPKGKILTGDAIPSIFPNYPKQAFTQSAIMSGKKSRMLPPPPQKGSRKQKLSSKGRVEVVDGYEIEYDAEAEVGFTPEPITVTIDDDEEAPVARKSAPPVKKPPPAQAAKPKPIGKILDISDAAYNLQYIYDMKERIQLPQAELWMFRMLVDKESKTRCIFITEIVSRLERLMFRRSIKIRQDLTFKVEANGFDFTQMFNETGNKVDSLYKLQEMILDLSAFKVCEGWSQFESVDPNSTGRKIEGIWFANNCEGLNLNNNKCRPCVALKPALLVRKSGLSMNSADPSVIQQIRKLPKDDPLHLQLQIQELLRDKTKLKYELSVVEKRESRLQDKCKMMEAGMKAKGKTVYVSAASSSTTMTSSQTGSSASTHVVVSPGKPSNPVSPTSTISYTPPRARMVRPRATTANTATTFSVTTRPAITQSSPSLVRKPTSIITPTPMYPVGIQSQNVPRHAHSVQQQQQPTNYNSGVGPYQPSILTPTFVLAQGSGHEIGHQAIETTQVIPSISLGSASLPGVNVTLQKSGDPDSGHGSEVITLLSL